jgi:hypothetical protein
MGVTAGISCGNCDEIADAADLLTMADSGRWCPACFDSDGSTCQHCNRRFHTDDVSFDNDNDAYCTRCQENGYGDFSNDDDDDDDDDESCYDDRIVFDHDATVFDILGLDEPDPTVLHFGFEIELNTRGGQKYEAARRFHDRVNGLGIVKHDGSIGYGRTGIELVSPPLSFDAIRFLIGQTFHNNALHEDAFADASCGMHVHASRSALTTSQVAKLVRFIHEPRNRAFMEALAGRSLLHSQWASITHRPPSWKASFDSRGHGREVWRMNDSYRYSALNLTNHNTIEFRIFASTTNVKRARANVEVCAALIAFCANASYSLALTAQYEAFCAFVCGHFKDYPHLTSLLTTIATPTATAVPPFVLT